MADDALNVPPEPVAGKFRWKNGLGVLLLGTTAELVVWNLLAPDSTNQIFASLPIIFGTLLALFLWWTFLSGLRWKVRLLGLAACLAMCAALKAAVRLDGYEGDMRPNLSWRWTPTSEEVARQYWDDRQPAAGAPKTGEHSDDVPELTLGADDWPGFRGPNRDGVVPNPAIRTDWQTRPPKQLWRHPVGLGWSSFAVADGLAFTQEQRGAQEAVVCYDLETGEELWEHRDLARFEEAMGGVGPRATPTIHDSRLYALGATGILNCLAARTGRLLWATNILEDAGAGNLRWAMSGSPLIDGDAVIVNPGGGNGNAVAAYQRLTGEKLWSAGDDLASYSAPRIETLLGVRQLLIFDGLGLAGHALEDGKPLWRFPWTNDPKVNVAQPIVLGEDSVFIGSGYATGSTRLKLSRTGGEWTVKPDWETKRLKMKLSDAVLKDGYIWGLDERILVSLDAETGKVTKHRRYGYGQLLLCGERILVQAEDGAVALVEASPDNFREIARFQALDGQTWNHPVLVGGRLLVRNAAEAACYDIGASSK